MAESKVYEIVLIGDGGVGKTALVDRHMGRKYGHQYSPADGINVIPLQFNTSNGNYILNIWNIISAPGEQKFFEDADGFIVMFDVTNHYSYIGVFNIATYVKEIGKPMVICGNKCDLADKPGVMKLKDIDIGTRFDCPFWLTSAKTNYNFEKPFMEIIRMVSGQNDITFTEITE